MSIKVGINGFGRIGRLVLRASLHRDDIQVVGVNDPFLEPDYMAYLLRYDTVHGRMTGATCAKDKSIRVDGAEIAVFGEQDPANIAWSAQGARIPRVLFRVFITGSLLVTEFRRPVLGLIWHDMPLSLDRGESTRKHHS